MTNRDKILFVALAAAFSIGGFRIGWGVHLGSPWWSHLAFQFTHGNIFHLLGNLFASFCLLRCQRVRWQAWLFSFIAASSLSFLYFFNQPLVGFSGTLMAVSGTLLPYSSRESTRRFLVALAACSVLSLFFHQLPAVLFHLVAMLLGILYTKTKRLNDDYRRTDKRTQERTL